MGLLSGAVFMTPVDRAWSRLHSPKSALDLFCPQRAGSGIDIDGRSTTARPSIAPARSLCAPCLLPGIEDGSRTACSLAKGKDIVGR